MDLIEVTVDRVIGNPREEFAVVVRGAGKAFLIFVGEQEATAIFREMKGMSFQRPLTHDLMISMMTAFDIEVRKIVISSIVQNIFCATLLLTQTAATADGPRKNEVRIDLRASDAIILALKSKTPIYAARDVVEQVEDVSPHLAAADSMQDPGSSGTAEPEGDEETGEDP